MVEPISAANAPQSAAVKTYNHQPCVHFHPITRSSKIKRNKEQTFINKNKKNTNRKKKIEWIAQIRVGTCLLFHNVWWTTATNALFTPLLKNPIPKKLSQRQNKISFLFCLIHLFTFILFFFVSSIPWSSSQCFQKNQCGHTVLITTRPLIFILFFSSFERKRKKTFSSFLLFFFFTKTEKRPKYFLPSGIYSFTHTHTHIHIFLLPHTNI